MKKTIKILVADGDESCKHREYFSKKKGYEMKTYFTETYQGLENKLTTKPFDVCIINTETLKGEWDKDLADTVEYFTKLQTGCLCFTSAGSNSDLSEEIELLFMDFQLNRYLETKYG